MKLAENPKMLYSQCGGARGGAASASTSGLRRPLDAAKPSGRRSSRSGFGGWLRTSWCTAFYWATVAACTSSPRPLRRWRAVRRQPGVQNICSHQKLLKRGQCALGMPCTQCAHSAKFWMSANTRTLVLAPFHKFLVPYQGFFQLPKHLGCGIFELSTIFAHFQPFPPISSPAWALAHGVRAGHL